MEPTEQAIQAAGADKSPHQRPLSDEQIMDDYFKERGIRQYIEAYMAGCHSPEQMQAYATASTEPLLKRIAELERQLEEARKDVERLDKKSP